MSEEKFDIYGVYEYADNALGFGFSRWLTFVPAVSASDALSRSGLSYCGARLLDDHDKVELEDTLPQLLERYTEAKADLVDMNKPREYHCRYKIPVGRRDNIALRTNVRYHGIIELSPGRNVKFFGWVSRSNIKLPSSLGFYAVVGDFARSLNIEEGRYYIWDGYFCNYEFVGKLLEISTKGGHQ